MASTLSPPTQPEFFEGQWSTEPSVNGKARPADMKNGRSLNRPASRGRRVLRAFARFLITLGIGIGGTVAWQSYGDETRQMIANAYPQQLGWLAPQPQPPASVAQITSATDPPAPPAAPSVDPQQVKGMLLDLSVVNTRVDQLAAQLSFLQQQTASEIAQLRASEQNILNKISAPPPRPAAVPAHKRAPLTLAPAVQTPPAR